MESNPVEILCISFKVTQSKGIEFSSKIRKDLQRVIDLFCQEIMQSVYEVLAVSINDNRKQFGTISNRTSTLHA